MSKLTYTAPSVRDGLDAEKPLVWLHGEIKTPPFTPSARLETGLALRRLQQGERLAMPQSRPMPGVGRDCHELRVRDVGHQWRVIYRIDDDAGDMTMQKRKRKALEADGWKVGTAQEFLRLSDEEVALIDLKLALGRALKERRTHQRLSQAAVAARIRSSQSRVAKMESGDSTVSIDLLVRTLLALGASRKDLAKSLT